MDFFLDSSALVKRYVQETGSAWTTTLIDPLSGHNIHVVTVSGVEVLAALARRQRTGTLPPADAASAIALWRVEFSNLYRLREVSVAVIARAMGIAERHALRGYDAVQLAAALELNAQRLAFGLPALVFVSADAILNAAASAETLPTDDPNAHP